MEDWSRYTGEDDSAFANYDPNNPPQFTKEDREWLDTMVDSMCKQYTEKQYEAEQQAKKKQKEGAEIMIPFKEYFKVLLGGKPDEFIEDYFNHNDKPYPERYHEFEKQLRALDNSGIELTEEMEDVLEEIDDAESGYGEADD